MIVVDGEKCFLGRKIGSKPEIQWRPLYLGLNNTKKNKKIKILRLGELVVWLCSGNNRDHGKDKQTKQNSSSFAPALSQQRQTTADAVLLQKQWVFKW